LSVAENLKNIKEEIIEACRKTNRSPEDITIIAVTKYVSVERAKEALEAGITNLGENRSEGLLHKLEQINNNNVSWHFIGTLQSRKVRDIIDKVDYIHSLDRLSLAKEIHKRAKKKIPCFVQVNVSGEESKHGLSPDQVLNFIKNLEQFDRIQVVGLMTMAPFTDDEKLLRTCFQTLRDLKESIEQLHLPYAPCHYLSMGMSNDYKIAIEEGATHIRIGTKLVGKETEV
jgi:PLP dependent protein